MEGNFTETKNGLFLTVVLGFYFTALQGLEYYEASFSMADGVYGSTFFIATGFHGLHVVVGTIFLLVCLVRHLKKEFRELCRLHLAPVIGLGKWHGESITWL